MRSWTKVLLGTALLALGLTAWLGPVILEYGLLPILAGLAVAGSVVGGVVLITIGTYSLTHREDGTACSEETPKTR